MRPGGASVGRNGVMRWTGSMVLFAPLTMWVQPVESTICFGPFWNVCFPPLLGDMLNIRFTVDLNSFCYPQPKVNGAGTLCIMIA